jgi:hypothetical protein
MPLEMLSLLCNLALATQEAPGPTASPEEVRPCPELQEKLVELDTDRRRMFEVRELNRSFIARLGEGRESLRIKANSNITIAERRILRIDTERDATLEAIQVRACKTQG